MSNKRIEKIEQEVETLKESLSFATNAILDLFKILQVSHFDIESINESYYTKKEAADELNNLLDNLEDSLNGNF